MFLKTSLIMKSILVILISTMLLGGCSSNNDKINELRQEIDIVKRANNSLELEVLDYKKRLDKSLKENESITAELSVVESEIDEFIEEHETVILQEREIIQLGNKINEQNNIISNLNNELELLKRLNERLGDIANKQLKDDDFKLAGIKLGEEMEKVIELYGNEYKIINFIDDRNDEELTNLIYENVVITFSNNIVKRVKLASALPNSSMDIRVGDSALETIALCDKLLSPYESIHNVTPNIG